MDEKQPEPATRVAGEPRCPWGTAAPLPEEAQTPRSIPASPAPWKVPHTCSLIPSDSGCWDLSEQEQQEEMLQGRMESSLHPPWHPSCFHQSQLTVLPCCAAPCPPQVARARGR